MKRYVQHEFLKVEHFAATEWSHPVHNHNHFELIFIHKGKGVHCLSGMHYPYNGSSLFLLAPCDFHRFEIEERTEFTFLKFTNAYFKQSGDLPATGSWNGRLQLWNQDMDEFLIYARQQGLPLLKSGEDALRVSTLMRLVWDEWKDVRHEGSDTVFLLIQSILSIVKRNVQPIVPGVATKQDEKITLILHYLHQHIHDAASLQLEHLAAVFGFSRHYLGVYFKEQSGMTLRDYLNQYKLQLIENRLQFSSLSLKEISNDLGFTDLSHFNKFFKSHKGINPSAFRDQLIPKQLS